MIKLDINRQKKVFMVKENTILRNALIDEGIYLPSACGGRGLCGLCKIKTFKYDGSYTEAELKKLTKEQIDAGIHLSCQMTLTQDTSIEIPEKELAILRYTGVVEKLISQTYDIKELSIRLTKPANFDFIPGQYVQLIVPPNENRKKAEERAYSIANAIDDHGHIRLIIRLVPNGIGSGFVHNELKEGDVIQVSGPYGDFRIHEGNASMICVAGGSGMSPFLSMLSLLESSGEINTRSVWFFFGAKTQKDLYYMNELAEYEKKHSNFHFIPALSDAQDDKEWNGEKGLITDVLASYLEKIKVSDTSNAGMEGYLCGSPGMIGACIQVMNKFNISEDKIFYDKFA